MSRYRFLTRPAWIVFHITVVLLVVLMINLSFWQLRRLHERRAFNADVRTRTAMAPQPYDLVVPPGTTVDGARPDEWRTVTATGTFDPANQILIRNRTFDDAPGYYVLTPLKRSDGTAILVVRGWVPLATSTSTQPNVPPPPTGVVTVDGRLRPTQNPGALASRDPATGVLTTMAPRRHPPHPAADLLSTGAGVRRDVGVEPAAGRIAARLRGSTRARRRSPPRLCGAVGDLLALRDSGLVHGRAQVGQGARPSRPRRR